MNRAEPAAQRGFTLLEVLAAFLIFAVIFTVLAGTASQAFRMEGENQRRMEASLLADEIFAGIERQARSGSPPALGESVEERDIFEVTTAVTELTPAALGLDLATPGEGEAGGTSTRSTAPVDGQTAPSIFSSGRDGASPLRHIELVIAWDEGDRRVEVRRATIALDTSQLGDLAPGAAAENPSTGGETGPQDAGGSDVPDQGRSLEDDLKLLDDAFGP